MHFTITPSAPNQIKHTKNRNIEELKCRPARYVLEVDGTPEGQPQQLHRRTRKPYRARAKTRRPLARAPPFPPHRFPGGAADGGGAALKAQRHLPSRPRRSRVRGAGAAGAAGPLSVGASSDSRAACAEPAPLLRF